MEAHVKRIVVDDKLLAQAFSRMVCAALCAGLVVSAAAGGFVLLIASLGS